ncbi:T9SS type A sorting domain-containing protein [Hymenobacter cellulosilyticus]|uniref:T9SS type A sorting domain-containing protein n=1 Tax=Hymenobacter cellulosilyticus TaxID=2932248 RepID=A0A8T9Q915_9BACT|nr:T9SS type A sorting domain-containing protein [Hymenobacter cellulosilyticus]UOQ71473.1 T9SS type A sorting domain-containing protein [Hymenobacter cellulosilyticus]
MKKFYFLVTLTTLVSNLPIGAVWAQVSVTGPVTLYIGPGGVVAVPASVTVGAGATLTNEGQLDLGADLINNGTVTAPTAPAALLRTVGTAPQNLAGSATIALRNLTVNNAAGVAIGANTTVAGTLTLTSGLVAIADGTPLVLLPTAPDPVETTTARLVGPVVMAARTVNEAAFEPFLGVSMPAGASVGALTITRVTGPTAIITAAGNTSLAVYWELGTTAAGSPARVLSFAWLAALDNGRNMAAATPWRSTAPYATWTRSAGPTANVSATNPRQYAPAGTGTEPVAGRFTFSDPNAPLPVELTAFTARRQGLHAQLDWTTASEKNNAYFDVERSRDGRVFERAGRIAGQGNSSTARNYQFVDANVSQYGVPTLYYRLRQLDQDQKAHHSVVRTVAVEGAKALLVSAWPNPSAGPGPHIRVEQPTDGPLTVLLTDATGRLLGEYRTHARVSDGLFAAETATLPSGVYLLRVTTTGTSQVVKLMRE